MSGICSRLPGWRLITFLTLMVGGDDLSTWASPPNVVVILADDLGFSDAGCYGGEIDTPNIDRLATGGLRFTQGYNTARCWPTRGALLTGYYPQAIRRDALPGGQPGKQGERPAWAALLPELLAPAGYRSYHSGKWHVDGDPRRQGFHRSLRVEGGQNDFFDPEGITVDGEPIAAGDDFYATTAIGDHAAECLRDHAADHAAEPFFLYVAFTSPHFPLHAPQDLIAKYRPRYRDGWDLTRQARYERLVRQGIITAALPPLERDVGPPSPFADASRLVGPGEVTMPVAWSELDAVQQDFQATKMAIHAAMVEMMDQAIGAVLDQLVANGSLDDTLVIFLSDNGASAELLIRGKGHDLDLPPGGPGTYLCLGPGWSSCANTPFRRHKSWVHEGGIATPWIVHWPRGIPDPGGLRKQPVHVIDIAPTILALAGVTPPAAHDGQPVPPMHGRSFGWAVTDANAPRPHDQLWWCHQGHRAVRVGDWKLVADRNGDWELYDLTADRTESENRAAGEPDRVTALAAFWDEIAAECRFLATATSETPRDSGKSPVHHVVLCWLKDSGNAAQRQRIIEASRAFRRIPGVQTVHAGEPVISDRPIVDDSFDVAITLSFADAAALATYLDHPDHRRAADEVLRPLVERIVVYDFQDR